MMEHTTDITPIQVGILNKILHEMKKIRKKIITAVYRPTEKGFCYLDWEG